MKKIIRFFLIVFCIFAVFLWFPVDFSTVFRSFTQVSVDVLEDAALSLSAEINALMEEIPEAIAAKRGPENGEGENGSPAVPFAASHEDLSGENTPDGTASNKDISDGTASGNNASGENAPDGTTSGNNASGENDSDQAADGTPRSILRDSDISYYYYTKISREERLIYDAMLSLANSAGTGEPAEETRLMDTNPSTEEFAQSYTRAYNALMTDHPELFWIAQGKSHYSCSYYVMPSFGGKYKIVLSIPDPYEGHVREQAALENAAENLLQQVDLSGSDASIALQIHDLLINNAWYNVEAGPDDYAHTAYGALVEDSMGNPGGALCDGYSLAYEYLLQRVGINSTMVCGHAGASDDDTEKHAWTLMQLDGDWYEADATWDDLDFEISSGDDGYELFLEALSDEDYIQSIRHYMWGRTTEEMRSFTPGDEYRYTGILGWVTLLQPSVHIRFTAEESEETRDYVTPLAPVAEGTKYSWDRLMEE